MEDNELIAGLIRNANYIKELYDIKEEVQFNTGMTRLYAHTKDKGLGIVIARIDLSCNEDVIERIVKTVGMIEDNLILVDNLWIERLPNNNNNKSHSQRFLLYIAEYTKSSYKKEFGLINLCHYIKAMAMGMTMGKDIEGLLSLISLLRSLIDKVKVMHCNKAMAHMNLTTENVYVNRKSKEVFFGPCQLGKEANEESVLWYMPPEYFHMTNESSSTITHQDLQCSIRIDIWSIGCIIAELFFMPIPLFQAFNQGDVMKRIIEVIGSPSSYDEVNYMSKEDYAQLLKDNKPNSSNKPIVHLLLEESDDTDVYYLITSIKGKIHDLMLKCLLYKPSERIDVDTLMESIDTIIGDIKAEEAKTKAKAKAKAKSKEELTTPVKSNRKDYQSYVNTNYRMNYVDTRSRKEGCGLMNRTFNELNKRMPLQQGRRDIGKATYSRRNYNEKHKGEAYDNEVNDKDNDDNSLYLIETQNRQYKRKTLTPTRLPIEKPTTTNRNDSNSHYHSHIHTGTGLNKNKGSEYEYQDLNMKLDDLVSYINDLKLK